MTRGVLTAALVCVAMASALAVMALRRLGIARRLLRVVAPDRLGARRGPCELLGVLEPGGALVNAPFTERPVLYARAVLHGVGPEGGPERVLWEKVLVAPALLFGASARLPVDLEGARVLVPREYRQGTLRALVPDVKLLPRVLSRAGYKKPPPSGQFFHLEEEVIAPGQRVFVLGERGEDGAVRGATGPLLVSNLSRGRVMLRAAWGPVLAAMLAVLILAAGATVVFTALWLR